jgi:spore coat polysaccharide biosynthesis predicted glycosyltransferase SpsG
VTGKALLLADAAPGAGLGHLARSTGLAQALREQQVEPVCFAVGATSSLERGGVQWVSAPELAAVRAEPGPGDIIVLDSYEIEAGDARRWGGEGTLVGFWDEGQAPAADFLISFALEMPPGINGVSGPEYACLGREYWEPPAAGPPASVDRIMVAAGGADPTNAASTICEAARRAVPAAEVVLALGPNARNVAPTEVVVVEAPASLRELLLEANLVVCAAGQTMVEAVATGTPCIALPVVSNQRPGAEMLAGLGAVRLAEPRARRLRQAIMELAGDDGARRALSARGMECVDGRGALRIATELARLIR